MKFSPILISHISAGILAMITGTVAIIYRKGSRGHRRAGNVFFVAMLIMASAGAFMAFIKYAFQGVDVQITNVFAGVLTCYLVGTAWSAARRGDGETSAFDWGALLVVLAVEASFVTLGTEAALSPSGLKYGYPTAFYAVFGIVGLIMATGDIRMLARGGVFGEKRVARHLWRMCLALFFATGSFFLGQQKVFPVSWRGAKIWFVPPLLTLVLLVYWLIRVLYTKEYKRTLSGIQTQEECPKVSAQSLPG